MEYRAGPISLQHVQYLSLGRRGSSNCHGNIQDAHCCRRFVRSSFMPHHQIEGNPPQFMRYAENLPLVAASHSQPFFFPSGDALQSLLTMGSVPSTVCTCSLLRLLGLSDDKVSLLTLGRGQTSPSFLLCLSLPSLCLGLRSFRSLP